MHSAIKVVVTC